MICSSSSISSIGTSSRKSTMFSKIINTNPNKNNARNFSNISFSESWRKSTRSLLKEEVTQNHTHGFPQKEYHKTSTIKHLTTWHRHTQRIRIGFWQKRSRRNTRTRCGVVQRGKTVRSWWWHTMTQRNVHFNRRSQRSTFDYIVILWKNSSVMGCIDGSFIAAEPIKRGKFSFIMLIL